MPRQKTLLRTILQPLLIAIGLAVVARLALHIYSIPSPSMAPTLEPGDQILVTRYITSAPERGDVVVFRSPINENELMVKRVIGLPGDWVDSRMGHVRIGGHTLPEPYVLRAACSGSIQSQLIPADSYFVLGDNREDSLDSRSWGLVSRAMVVGRARVVLWSSPLAGGKAFATSVRPAKGEAHPHSRLFKWID